MKRAAYTPKEFSALFGKSQTWGYRQIQAGKVNAIKDYGRILIPADEVERVLASAGRYLGMSRPVGEAREFDEPSKELKMKSAIVRRGLKRKVAHLRGKGLSSHVEARKRLMF